MLRLQYTCVHTSLFPRRVLTLRTQTHYEYTRTDHASNVMSQEKACSSREPVSIAAPTLSLEYFIDYILIMCAEACHTLFLAWFFCLAVGSIASKTHLML